MLLIALFRYGNGLFVPFDIATFVTTDQEKSPPLWVEDEENSPRITLNLHA